MENWKGMERSIGCSLKKKIHQRSFIGVCWLSLGVDEFESIKNCCKEISISLMIGILIFFFFEFYISLIISGWTENLVNENLLNPSLSDPTSTNKTRRNIVSAYIIYHIPIFPQKEIKNVHTEALGDVQKSSQFIRIMKICGI